MPFDLVESCLIGNYPSHLIFLYSHLFFQHLVLIFTWDQFLLIVVKIHTQTRKTYIKVYYIGYSHVVCIVTTSKAVQGKQRRYSKCSKY